LVKRIFPVLLVFTCLIPELFPQSQTLPRIVSLTLTPNPGAAGQDITLSAILTGLKTQDTQPLSASLPRGLSLYRGPSVQPTVIPPGLFDGGPSETGGVRIQWVFRAAEGGRYILPGFDIRTPEGTLSTGALMVEVGVYQNRELIVPLRVAWNGPGAPVWTGEVIPLILEVLREREISLVDSVFLRPPASGLWDSQVSLGEILSIREEGIAVYQIPVASCLFTPTEGRSVVIPPARVVSGKRSGTSAALNLTVLPLPQELASTGAIGQFELSLLPEGETLTPGDEALFYLRLTGRGNLNYLRIPELEFSGAEVLSVLESQNWTATPQGYEGYRQVNYLVTLGEGEELTVRVPPFPYLDKTASPQVRLIPPSVSRFSLTSHAGGRENPEAAPYPDLLPPRQEFLYHGDFRRNQSLLFLFLPGPVFYLLAILLGRKPGGPAAPAILLIALGAVFLTSGAAPEKENPEAELLAAYGRAGELYRQGRFDQTLEALTELDSAFGDQGFHHFNRSLAQYKRENLPAALFEIHRGIRLSPMDSRFRNLLTFLETQGEIVNSYPPMVNLDIRLLFLLFALGINVAALLGGLYQLKPGGGLIVSTILSLAFTLTAAALGGAAWASEGAPRGLVYYPPSAGVEAGKSPSAGEGVFLKQIPRQAGGDWLPLRNGCLVRIRSRAQGFALVETGSGLKGWIEEGCLLLLEEDL
jgi:hypothetical protein